jgi:hypothetical protein
MCSGSEEGSYLRLIVSVYHSTLGLKEIKRRKEKPTQNQTKPISGNEVAAGKLI